MNSVYLRRKNRIMVSGIKGAEPTNVQVLATAMKNLESLGYVMTRELAEACQLLGDAAFLSLYHDVIETIKVGLGAHRKFNPMYPNFPKQVMEASEAELYINAVMHYLGDWIGVRIMPDYVKENRPKLSEKTEKRILALGSEADYIKMFQDIMSSKTSISVTDKTDLAGFLLTYKDDLASVLPESIPNKEILAFVASTVLDNGLNPDAIRPYFKTATDVLRLAVAMSGGDISLAKPTRFRNFKRAERKMLMTFLNSSGNGEFSQITEDMLRWKLYWIRLGEKLHAGDYSKTCPVACLAFDTIRNDKPFQTTNSKIEASIKAGDAVKAVSILKWRAGDFARRLDHLLRMDIKPITVLRTFNTVSDKVSTPVLLQVMNHFANRDSTIRAFMPKGNVAKIQTVANNLPAIRQVVCKRVVSICRDALLRRFSKLDRLGKVWIDPVLKKYNVPFSQRSASKALKTLVRGSRVGIDNSKPFLRFFIWWHEKDQRIDVDLSATAFDNEWNHHRDITFWNLRSDWAWHSGDITSAPNGACEFIDIDIQKAREVGIRYISMSVNSYTHQHYCDLPECFAGFMIRKDNKQGQVFDARTVENRIDLASDTQMVVPAIFDLETMEMIWADMGIASKTRLCTVKSNRRSLQSCCQAMANLKKPNLFDLFSLHAEARGEIVDNPSIADTVFTVKKKNTVGVGTKNQITPFDTETIMANYL